MYYDDVSLRDLAAAKGAGQMLVNTIFTKLGAPLSERKQQRLADGAEFLGLEHDVSQAFTTGEISFWPRAGLIDQIRDRILEILESGVCTSNQANKLLGVLGFTATGMWSRVGRIGVGVLQQRAHARVRTRAVDPMLVAVLDFFLVLLQAQPRRVAPVLPPALAPVVIASDAQADSSPTGGYLLIDTHSGEKVGACFDFGCAFLQAVGFAPEDLAAGGNPIAQCEAAAVVMAAIGEAHRLRERDVLWFVDNTSALHCLVKGGARNAHLARSVHVLHLLSYHLRCRIWFEYVPSGQNWSDGVSRAGLRDPMGREAGLRSPQHGHVCLAMGGPSA